MKAEITSKKVEIEYTLNLTLNEREYWALNKLLGSVTGSPDGPRGFFDELFYKMKMKADRVDNSKHECFSICGNIQFADTWPNL